MASTDTEQTRDVVFISKATPGDDEFVLWLAPRLEAAGYKVFADILGLEPGERWRRTLTETLQNKAIKLILCCQDDTLAKEGVQEEIGIASDLAKDLEDPKFIIPLRLKKYKKVFGIGELQYVDFEKSWAAGLGQLLAALEKQNVPRASSPSISPHWESYRRRDAIEVKREPEVLTSNWLRVTEGPTFIRYFTTNGTLDHGALRRACKAFEFPAEIHERGFFTFATSGEVNDAFSGMGRFYVAYEMGVMEFIQDGLGDRNIRRQEASNIVLSMLRKAWNDKCRKLGLLEYTWSKLSGFHASKELVETGKKVPWGRQGDRRSSMLRNAAGGYVWQFGVTAIPAFWPYAHFKLKARVLFAEEADGEAAASIDDKKKQHRLRRRICKGWRNKQWHGRMMAMLEVLSGDIASIHLPVSADQQFVLDATPIPFTLPVTTELPDVLTDEQEEQDESTIITSGREMEDAE